MNLIEDVVLEDSSCPLGCQRDDKIILVGSDRLHDLPGEFSVVRCRGCGLMRTNPRPTPETIGAYYPSTYAPHQSSARPMQKSPKCVGKTIKSYLGLDVNVMPNMSVGNLLEIGCASGAYLEQMRQKGWNVSGIEFSESAALLVNKLEIPVQVATVESAKAPAQKLDVIAAWMVLEHLHNPVGTLNILQTWIKPEGFLIASLPDCGSIELRLFGARWYALQVPTHLYHYTVRSIAKVLHQSGWELVRVAWQKNCNNLLWSLEYLAHDKRWARLETSVRWLRISKKARILRIILGWLLGVTRQSGRMEIWARPSSHKKG